MAKEDDRPVGLTKDTGFQIGVRRTLPIQLEDAWQLLISPVGVECWLGVPERLEFTKGASYRLKDGARGEIRVFKPFSHLRLTWQPPDWERATTIQVRVIPRQELTVIAFHQEHLPDAAARASRRDFFKAAIRQIEGLIPAS